MARSDKVVTLEEAKAQFETALAAMAGVGEAAGNAVAPEHESHDRPAN